MDTDDDTQKISDILEEFKEEAAPDAVHYADFDADEDPRNLSEEAALVAGENSDIPEQPEPIGFEPNAQLMDDPYRDLKERIEARFQKEFNKQTVVVSEDERRRFLRAALHGDRFWFDIEFEHIGASVRIIPAPSAWSDAAAAAAHKLQKEGRIGEDINSWVENFQAMHIWMQTDSINGEPIDWMQAKIEKNGREPGHRELIEWLMDDANIDQVRRTNSPRGYLLRSAIRIAEIKNCLCMDGLSDGSFFSTAGTN